MGGDSFYSDQAIRHKTLLVTPTTEAFDMESFGYNGLVNHSRVARDRSKGKNGENYKVSHKVTS